MSAAQAYQTRRLARSFTPYTPLHHPLLDPQLPEEDIPLVPADLAPRGRLSWVLPSQTVTNLHIMLKLTDQTDRLMDEFLEAIPRINEILHEWVEMRGSSPTTTGEQRLRLQSRHPKGDENAASGDDKIRHDDLVFNMVRRLDICGKADVVYLSNFVDDSDVNESVLPNIRAVEFLDFDDSYVHVSNAVSESDTEGKASSEGWETESTVSEGPDSPFTESDYSGSTLPRLDTEGTSERDHYLTGSVYDTVDNSKINDCRRSTGPYEKFWRNYAYPNGSMILKSQDHLAC